MLTAAPQKTSKKQSRDKGSIFLVALLLTFIGLVGATFVYVSTQADYDKQYLNLSGELRVLSQRIAKEAEAAITGTGDFNDLKKASNQFEQGLTTLKQGDPRTGLPPSPAEVKSDLASVEKRWTEFRANNNIILNNEELLKSLGQFVTSINEITPKLTAASEELVQMLIEKNFSTPEELFLASRQVMLSQRIGSNVNKVFERGQGSALAAQAADVFRHDAALFVQVLEGMREGNEGLRIKRIGDFDVRQKLDEISKQFAAITELDLLILERFPDLFKTQDAANSMSLASNKLLKETTDLVTAYAGLEGGRQISPAIGYGLGTIALFILLLIGLRVRGDALRRLEASSQENRRNQEAILRLLDEMADLADGDLTARATVTTDITGAIADAMNYAVDALRNLVAQINTTTQEVSSAAQGTQATAKQLSQASDQQSQQITEVGTAINVMAASIGRVSANAAESAGVAQNSVTIANKGANAVQNTIQGMDIIREQIQETSKRIKRLAESSQEIGDIVELINDIADQTNILALNAAIQAAMAGEAGRGFAVVADEVQRLAERSGNATKQIEALVKTIQTDTNEAIISMEQSTSGVVTGARLAQDAGAALKEIETISSELAGLIKDISATAHEQSASASIIAGSMNTIQQITTQTSLGTTETAGSVGTLAALANDLRKSVAGFKLPA
ncbi:MAG: methyl-accepting chemotaxis protein [Gammaproteobacteria bacterium]